MAKTIVKKIDKEVVNDVVNTIAEDDKVLEIIKEALDVNKAEDVEVIDLRGKTSIASYMVVASGTSQRHVVSLAEHIQAALKKNKYPASLEGQEKGDWVLVDAFDVIVHVFKPEVREFYNLEKMWKALITAKPEKAKK